MASAALFLLLLCCDCAITTTFSCKFSLMFSYNVTILYCINMTPVHFTVILSDYNSLVYATREPPKMAQFDWFAISGYWAISHD